jgi:hypothetical protein
MIFTMEIKDYKMTAILDNIILLVVVTFVKRTELVEAALDRSTQLNSVTLENSF